MEIELGDCQEGSGSFHPRLQLVPRGPFKWAYVCEKCDSIVLVVEPRIIVVGNK